MTRQAVWLLAMVICAALVCSAGALFLLYLGHWVGHEDDEDEHEGD